MAKKKAKRRKKRPGRKQSSTRMSMLAGKVMAGYTPTPLEVRRLAASVLSQDETKGPQRSKTR